MHVRISTVAGAGDVDGVAAFVRDQALPQLQQQNGFRGLTVSGDRATGTVGVLSLWDSEADFQEEVLPDIKATPGFQAVRNLVNRATGQAVVGTIWADDASLAAVEAQVEARRQRAAERGVEFGEISIREVLFSAL